MHTEGAHIYHRECSAAQQNMIVYYMGNLYTAPADNARKGEADALPFLDHMATLMPTIR
jgi:hypothetical protein